MTETTRGQTARRAPGPGGIAGVGCLREMRRDVLGLMMRGVAAHGEVVRFKAGPFTVHLLRHPDDIAHVFAHPERYDKRLREFEPIRGVTGNGLLVTNGEVWAEQRRAVQPAFSAARVAGFVPIIVRLTRRMLERWDRAGASGEAIDVASEMMRLTFAVVEAALFSTDSGADIGELERAITVALRQAYRRIENPFAPPLWAPTPGNLAFRRARRLLYQRVDAIIAERRTGGAKEDLLGELLNLHAAGCPHLDGGSLRSQTITLLLAGHETTANALAWLFYLLHQHPGTADDVAGEAGAVLGDGEAASKADVDRLQLTTMTGREAMRLYTPIWAVFRRAAAGDVVRGFRIPKNTRVIISPWVTHRHPEFWSEPERFDPGRFEPAKVKAMHPCAYIPFGGGPRFCVGQSLARLELVLIAAMVAQRYRLTLVPGQRVEPEPGITLRCRHGLRMRLERRERK